MKSAGDSANVWKSSLLLDQGDTPELPCQVGFLIRAFTLSPVLALALALPGGALPAAPGARAVKLHNFAALILNFCSW